MLKYKKFTFFSCIHWTTLGIESCSAMVVPNPTSYLNFCVYQFFMHLLNNFWCLKLLSHGCFKFDFMFEFICFLFYFFNYFFCLCICWITLNTKSCLAMALPNPTSWLNFFCFSFYSILFLLFFFFCALTKQLSTSRITRPWPFLTWLHRQFHLFIYLLFVICFFFWCTHREILNAESCLAKAISNLTLCSNFFVFQNFHAFVNFQHWKLLGHGFSKLKLMFNFFFPHFFGHSLSNSRH